MTKERFTYIDNIRIWMTVLVILHHTAITYGAQDGTITRKGLVSGKNCY